LHDKELHNLYSSLDNIRVIKSRRMGEIKSVYKVLVRKYEGKKPNGRSGIGQRVVTELIWHFKHSNEQRYYIMNTLSIFLKHLQSVSLD